MVSIFNVNLLKLRLFSSGFVSNLANSVRVLHTFLTSGLIKIDVMFRMRASSSLSRKGRICSAVLGHKCKELEFTGN